MCTFAVTSYAEVWIEIKEIGVLSSSLKVTSYAEVWIEIWSWESGDHNKNVTSYAEVWIEIKVRCSDCSSGSCHLLRGGVDWNRVAWKLYRYARMSPPTRRCGLKFTRVVLHELSHAVTSYAEVWIEICMSLLDMMGKESPPTRRCGLKSAIKWMVAANLKSPPTRRCGLK